MSLGILRASIVLTQITYAAATREDADDISQSLMRQAILLQCSAILICIESLEESLVMTSATSIVLHYRNEQQQNVGLLPIQMYLLVIVPSHVMGITERFMGKSIESTKAFTLWTPLYYLREMSAYSCMIPAHIMYSAFMHDYTPETCSVIGLVFVVGGLALQTRRIGLRTSRFICPHTLQFHKPHRPSTMNAPYKRYASEILGIVMVSLVSTVQLVNPHAGKFLVTMPIAVTLQFSEFKRHMHSRIQGRLWILLGFAIASQSHNVALCRVLIYMCLAASFTCSLLACTNELIYTQLAQENEAESFLSHAVKQKFAAVGGAVSQILVRIDLPLLRTVMNKCHIGHARCHASNLYRKLEQGELRACEAKMFEYIDGQLENTPVTNMLFTACTQYTGNLHVAGEADWEIIHLVLCELARKDRTVVLVCCCDKNGKLSLTLNQAIQNVHVILRRLVKEVNARFEANVPVFEMEMRKNTLLTTGRILPNSSTIVAATTTTRMSTRCACCALQLWMIMR